MSNSQTPKPIEIKISTVVAVSAILHESDLAVLRKALQEMTGGAPDYFDNEFTVIDLSSITGSVQNIDWPELISLFKTFHLNPVAVRNAPLAMQEEILTHGLSLDTLAPPKPSAPVEPPSETTQIAAPVLAAPIAVQPARDAMIVDVPVRAGQRIYAQGCDLIITAVVNNGAEIIADGSIHVYSPLRGRALAGASGNSAARIFAMSMEAELISIAGIYRTFEDGLPEEIARRPAQIRLEEDRLMMSPLNASMRG